MTRATHRSTPAFAVGGVSWLGPSGRPSNIELPPEGFWRCFICNDVFYSIPAAFRHFGVDPKVPPRCEREDDA